MEELTKVRVDWKKIVVVGFLVVLTGLVSTGATWYVMDISRQAELDIKDDEIGALKNENATLKAISTSKETDEQTEAPDWKIYTNNEYHFSLTFPESWKGYTVEKKTASDLPSYSVYLPTTEPGWGGKAVMFSMGVFTREQWAELQSHDGPKHSLIGTTRNYVLGLATPHDGPVEIAALSANTKEIVETFTAL